MQAPNAMQPQAPGNSYLDAVFMRNASEIAAETVRIMAARHTKKGDCASSVDSLKHAGKAANFPRKQRNCIDCIRIVGRYKQNVCATGEIPLA